MCSASSPHNSHTRMFSAFNACSFCSALVLPLHINKTWKACMFRQFVYQLWHPLSFSYLCSTWASCPSTSSGLQKLFDCWPSSLLTCASPETISVVPSTLQLPYSPWGAHIPAYNSKYLDCDRRPAQCTSWSFCPETPSYPEPQDPTYVSGWLITPRHVVEQLGKRCNEGQSSYRGREVEFMCLCQVLGRSRAVMSRWTCCGVHNNTWHGHMTMYVWCLCATGWHTCIGMGNCRYTVDTLYEQVW